MSKLNIKHLLIHLIILLGIIAIGLLSFPIQYRILIVIGILIGIIYATVKINLNHYLPLYEDEKDA